MTLTMKIGKVNLYPYHFVRHVKKLNHRPPARRDSTGSIINGYGGTLYVPSCGWCNYKRRNV